MVVTRPRELAAALAAAIQEAGGTPWLFPTIEILPPADPEAVRRRLSQLRGYDLAFFVSPTAVARALDVAGPWPETLAAYAVGEGTRAALERRGVPARSPEDGTDSEALLRLPELGTVAGKRVLIVRGEGGRALLGDTLAARGAEVHYVECYRRGLPQADPAPLLAAWGEGRVHAVTVSSTEGLANLFTLLGAGGTEALRSTPLFVPHARVAEAAAERGVQTIIVSGPRDPEVLARLVAYFDAS